MPRMLDELGMRVEQLDQPLAVAGLERAVGEHERRRRLLAARERRDVPRQLVPAREAVPPGEVAPRVGERDAVHGRDPFRAALVVVEVVVERLLDLDP